MLLKVLLIDDDTELLETMAFGLARADVQPILAHEPRAALAAVETQQPDCVVLDLDLGRWSGFDVLEQIRERSEVPVLMLTADGTEAVSRLAMKMGAQGHLVKPISLSELLLQIQWAAASVQQPVRAR